MSDITQIELRLSNVYLVEGDEVVLIDTGIGDDASIGLIYDHLKITGLDLIINTHEHPDHFYGNKRIKEFTNAKVSAHKWASHMIGGVDILLEDGDIIDLGTSRLRIIHTPGHSPGHVCIYEEEGRILFSGDHVLGNSTTYIGSGGDMTDYIDSLYKLLDFEMRAIFPAHGKIVNNPHERIKGEIEHKKQREREILELLNSGFNSIGQLTKELYKFQNPFLIEATREYLKKLKKEGRIISKGDKFFISSPISQSLTP
jgi:glyoxylase-like metal-dependent hydrolase (beta-lactamase superfamily II)